MQFPKKFVEIATKAVAKYPDPGTAAMKAEEAMRKLPEFDSLVDAMVSDAILTLTCDLRHESNKAIKKENGGYGMGSSYASSCGSGSDQAYESVYNYKIAGTFLGLVRGSQLASIAEHESSIAEGHLFNVRLCTSLRSMVKNDQMVQEAVSEKRLQNLFRRLQGDKRKSETAA